MSAFWHNSYIIISYIAANKQNSLQISFVVMYLFLYLSDIKTLYNVLNIFLLLIWKMLLLLLLLLYHSDNVVQDILKNVMKTKT